MHAIKTARSLPTQQLTPTKLETAIPGRTGVSADAIRDRALEIYLSRTANGQYGDELSDWLQAERELNSGD